MTCTRRGWLAALASLGAVPAQAGLVDWFNGVRVDARVELPPLDWLAAPPPPGGAMTLWYFWATWCEPCRQTLPLLNTWLTRHPALRIVAVTDEPEATVRSFAERVPLQMAVALDPRRALLGPLGIRALPYAMLLDRHQVVRWKGQPKDLETAQLQAWLAET